MNYRKYIDKFIEAFSESMGYGLGIILVLYLTTIVILKSLEKIKVDHETAISFSSIVLALTFLYIVVKTVNK